MTLLYFIEAWNIERRMQGQLRMCKGAYTKDRALLHLFQGLHEHTNLWETQLPNATKCRPLHNTIAKYSRLFARTNDLMNQ